MKIFLVLLGIGTLLTSALVGTSLSLTQKGQSRWSTYTSSKYNSRRYTTRIGPFHYRRQAVKKDESEKLSFWARFARRSRQSFPPSSRALLTSRHFLKKSPPKLLADARFKTLDPKDYLVAVPSSFSKVKDSVYKNKEIPLSFRIVRSPSRYKCNQNFALCAISFNKDFKHKQQVHGSYDRLVRFQKKQTRAHDFKRYPTFIENFKASLFGQENIYLLFSAYDPTDKSVIRIEAVSDAHYEKEAAQMMYQIFETFRF